MKWIANQVASMRFWLACIVWVLLSRWIKQTVDVAVVKLAHAKSKSTPVWPFQKADVLSLWWACMQTCFMFKHCPGCTAPPLVSSTAYKKNHFDQTNMNIQWSSGLVLAPPTRAPIKPSDLSDSSPRTDESHANSRFRLITIHTTSLCFLQCTAVWVLQLIRCPSGMSGLVGVHCYSLRHCLHGSAAWAPCCLLKLSLSERFSLFTLALCL